MQVLARRSPTESRLDRTLGVRSIMAACGHAQPLTMIGRFRVDGLLGGGGMGVVYRAYDSVLGRSVALKIARGGDSSLAAARLHHEANALAKAQTPHVAAIYELGSHNGELFLVTELVEGVTLADWLERRRPTVRQRLDVLAQIAKGLQAIHNRGVVHRDINLVNVMVDAAGRARLIDFGTAIVGGRPGPRLENAFTAGFHAPEVLRGGDIDSRADQYSLCRVVRKAMGDHPLDGKLDRAVHRGTADDPDDRWENMGPLVDRLARAAYCGQPIGSVDMTSSSK